MKNTLKPSIVLSGFVSSFKYKDELVYLITYNSNGKCIDKVEDTFDPISILKELQFNHGIDKNTLLQVIYDHKKSSFKIVNSIEQVEFINSKFKVFIFALVGDKSELYFSNFDESNKIEVLNWKSTLSIQNLSVDDYEKYIQDEQNS
jgi:hypothetical protein